MQKILIAEDDAVLREAYIVILRYAGYQVVEATDGREAVKKVEQERPALLILDMLMPGMTGLEVLQDKRIRALRKDMKVIAFTNLSDPVTIKALEVLGVDKYLLKSSVMPQTLIENVRQVLEPSEERF